MCLKNYFEPYGGRKERKDKKWKEFFRPISFLLFKKINYLSQKNVKFVIFGMTAPSSPNRFVDKRFYFLHMFKTNSTFFRDFVLVCLFSLCSEWIQNKTRVFFGDAISKSTKKCFATKKPNMWWKKYAKNPPVFDVVFLKKNTFC